MVTITRHIFINIFQTEHFLAVKCSIGYEKNMSFLNYDSKISKSLKKNVKRWDWAPLIIISQYLPGRCQQFSKMFSCQWFCETQ